MEFICYPKCSTCQKAKKWLDENKIEYTERHIVDDNPTYEDSYACVIFKRHKKAHRPVGSLCAFVQSLIY